MGVPLFTFGLLNSAASYSIPPLDETNLNDGRNPPYSKEPDSTANAGPEPIYMSYEDLRSAFKVEEPRQAKRFGKILLLGQTLFVSEPNVGMHILDNTDPSKPVGKFFLNVPGNIIFAAKDDILYADSFVNF